MNKVDDAWAVLKELPLGDQEVAAAAILDFAATARGSRLTDQQAAIVESRLRDSNARTITTVELRARLGIAES